MATLYSKVENYIRDGINSGKWQPGDLLPKEMELCEMFGVSRPTVRTALTNLVHEGYITRTKRKGTVVREWRTLESGTVFIESFQQEMKQRGILVITEVLEFRRIEAPPIVLEKMNLPPNAMVVKLTRLRYGKNSFDKGPVVLTTSYLQDKLWPLIQNRDMEKNSLRETLKKNGFERHVMEKEITIYQLDDREARLLGEEAKANVIKIETVAWDKDNRIIELCDSLYPADRNQFLLRIRK